MSVCNDCAKKDVCNQKEIAQAFEKELVNVKISVGHNSVYVVSALRSNFGLSVEAKCSKKLKDRGYASTYGDDD